MIGEVGTVVQGALPAPYYSAHGVTLYHGDTREILPLLSPVDHVITDPPYLLNFDNCVTAGTRRKFVVGGNQTESRPMGYLPFSLADVETIAPEIARLARRWAVVFSDAESNHIWRALMIASGTLRHIRVGAWIRPNATPQFTGDRPGTGFELCEIAHSVAESLRWNGGGRPACWSIEQRHGHRSEGGEFHPTPKPLDLVLRIVEQFTDPGEAVLDPYAGSGSLGCACKALGRDAILVEREEAFCEGIAKRVEAQPILWRADRTKMRQSGLAWGDDYAAPAARKAGA